jgi:sn-glycerol 3-phosphate transport system substrate-binding protein
VTDTGKTVITVWLNDYLYPGYLDPALELAERFGREHPGYHVEITGFDFRTMPAAVAGAAERGAPPDLAEYFYTATQLARDTRAADGRPLFTSVERAVGGRSEILGVPVAIDDLVPAARRYFSVDGELLSVPPTASTLILYANTTLLERAGVEELPRSWSELEAAAKAVTALEDGPPHAITWPNHGWFFQQAVAQQGGLIVDRDNGRSGRAESVHLDSDELMAYVRFWQRLADQGHYRYAGAAADWMGTYDAFAAQEVAFAISTSVEAGRMLQAGRDNGFTVRTGWVPSNDTADYAGVFVGGDSLWLTDGLSPEKRDGALAFIQYLLQPGHVADWHKANGRVPITRSAVALLEEEGWFADHPDLRTATDQLDAADGSPASLGPLLGDFGALNDATTEAMHDVLTAGADPVTRFAAAQAQAQARIDDYNRDDRTTGDFSVAW